MMKIVMGSDPGHWGQTVVETDTSQDKQSRHNGSGLSQSLLKILADKRWTQIVRGQIFFTSLVSFKKILGKLEVFYRGVRVKRML